MLKNTLICLLVANLNAGRDLSYPEAVFEKPIKTVSTKLKAKGSDVDQTVCSDFGDLAIANISSAKDCDTVEVRYDSGSKKLCQEPFSGSKYTIADPAMGCFVGLHRPFIFLESEDLGSIQGVKIFKLPSVTENSKIKESVCIQRKSGEPIALESTGSKTAIIYYRKTPLSCSLIKEGTACWQRALLENRIPSTLQLKIPDCRKSFDWAISHLPYYRGKPKKALETVPDLFLKVKAKDILKPDDFEFLSGETYCDFPG